MNLLRPTPDKLTKHLLPRHIIQAADFSTPLRVAQNDRRIIFCLCVTSFLKLRKKLRYKTTKVWSNQMPNYPKVKSVTALPNLKLRVTFVSGTVKIYNCALLITEEAFRPLKDEAFFKNVRVDSTGYGIIWNDYVDLSESELWVNGITANDTAAHVDGKR